MAKKAGRPTKYTKTLAAKICARIAEGESVKSICRDDAMPVASTVFLWLGEHAEFSDQYAIAKEESAEFHADEIISIADDTTGDVARDRLRVDARKWVASKLKPKKYGDKIDHDHNHTGEFKVTVQRFSDRPIAPE